jgi:hypothetical protein
VYLSVRAPSAGWPEAFDTRAASMLTVRTGPTRPAFSLSVRSCAAAVCAHASASASSVIKFLIETSPLKAVLPKGQL